MYVCIVFVFVYIHLYFFSCKSPLFLCFFIIDNACLIVCLKNDGSVARSDTQNSTAMTRAERARVVKVWNRLDNAYPFSMHQGSIGSIGSIVFEAVNYLSISSSNAGDYPIRKWPKSFPAHPSQKRESLEMSRSQIAHFMMVLYTS